MQFDKGFTRHYPYLQIGPDAVLDDVRGGDPEEAFGVVRRLALWDEGAGRLVEPGVLLGGAW